MARRPLQMTPFSRFLLIMVLVAPLAYLGASWYNGEDGVGKIKQFIREKKEVFQNDGHSSNSATKTDELDQLRQENERLKKELEEKDRQLEEFRKDAAESKKPEQI